MIIIKDTREKNPWDFSFYPECEAEYNQALPTGDYTIFGYEKKIIIDRKASVEEIAMNISKKSIDRFTRELERMKEFDERYIICEFSLDDLISFPKNSVVPVVKVNGEYVLKRILELEKQFNVQFIFCRDRIEAQDKVMELFKNVVIKKD